MEQVPGGEHGGVQRGLAEGDHAMHNAPPTAHAGTTTPPDHSRNCSVWELITGPEASHWSTLLVRDHLDSSARLSLSGTCTAARDLVMVTAKHATLRWHAPDDQANLARLQAALAARGKLSTTLVVQLTVNDEVNLPRLQAVQKALLACAGNVRTRLELRGRTSFQLMDTLRALEEGTTGLDELLVVSEKELLGKVVATIGRCCPNLRALHMPHNRLYQKLPSPELFPKLRELSFGLPQEDSLLQRVMLTTAPFIKQLTHLDISYTTLDDTLLGLILQWAPALQELAVASLELQSAAHAGIQAPWRRLQVGAPGGTLWLSGLARLPQTPWLEVVCGSGQLTLRCDTTDEGSIAAHLKSMRVSITTSSGCEEAAFCIEPPLSTSQQPAALRLCLSLLRSWPVSGHQPTIELDRWRMSTQLLQELPGLPPWRQLQCHNVQWPGKPQSYSALLGLLPDSYCEVRLELKPSPADWYGQLSTERVRGICSGAPSGRSLRLVLLGGENPELVQAIHAEFPDVVFQPVGRHSN